MEGAFTWIQKTPFVQTVSLKDGVFTIRYENEAPEVMDGRNPPGRSVGRAAPHFGRKTRPVQALSDAFVFALEGGERAADADDHSFVPATRRSGASSGP